MTRLPILASLIFLLLLGPAISKAQDGVAPGTVAAISSQATSSEWQNWMFALGAMVSATAGILLVSWEPGAGAQNH